MESSHKNELSQGVSTITKQKERFIFMTVPKSKRQKSRFEVFHNMQTLQKELEKLNDKRTKLSQFLAKPNNTTLSATQRELLKEQKQAMAKYAKVLELRIKNLEAKNDDYGR